VGVALADQLPVEQTAVREPDVEQQPVVAVADVLGRVAGHPHRAADGQRLLRPGARLAAEALDRSARVDRLGGADADQAGPLGLAAEGEVHRVAVDDAFAAAWAAGQATPPDACPVRGGVRSPAVGLGGDANAQDGQRPRATVCA
jgi:hypothetical protein